MIKLTFCQFDQKDAKNLEFGTNFYLKSLISHFPQKLHLYTLSSKPSISMLPNFSAKIAFYPGESREPLTEHLIDFHLI